MIVVEIPWIDPIEAASALADQPRLAFLDSAMTHDTLGRWSYLSASPFGVFQVVNGIASWNDVPLRESPMAALRRLLAEHAQPAIAGGPPFTGGAIGTIAYEAGHLFETLPVAGSASTEPQINLPFYDRLFAFDVIERRAFAIAPDDTAIRTLRQGIAHAPMSRPTPTNLAWRDSRSRAAYEAEVGRVIAYIREGDIFQANLSHRFSAMPTGGADPIAQSQSCALLGSARGRSSLHRIDLARAVPEA